MAEIKVPSLGESVSEATVAQWLKKEGETVGKDEPVVELETDKVTLEVNAPEAGVITKIQVNEGDAVTVGAILGSVEQGAAANDAGAKAAASTTQAKTESKQNQAKGTGKMEDIVVPTLGESVSEATIAQWLKQEGEQVGKDEPLVELETDKATMEVNAPAGGVLKSIKAKAGETVEIGSLLGQLEVGAEASSGPAKPAAESKPAAASSESTAEHKLSPAVRKLVDDEGIDPSHITGTGKDGRITKEDVLNYMEEAKTAASTPAPEAISPAPPKSAEKPRPAGEREERVRMTKLRKSIAKRLKEAQNTAAMLTTFNEVDMTAVMDLRKQYKEVFEKKHGVKLGFMSFFVKAAVNALSDLPAINASIDGDDIVYKNYYNISVAVSTPQGLVVPVVRDCDEKSMAQVEKDIMDMGARARDGKLGLDEMTGGTFTITNGGTFGSLLSTPIINPPQTAILGMHKIQQRPMVMPDGSIQARPMMYLALSYDHRLVDGKEAVTFLVKIKEAIEDPQRLILSI